MNSPKISSFLSTFCLLLFIFPIIAQGSGGIFKVQRKYAGNKRAHVNDLKKHDEQRHSRILTGKPIDIYMGGNLTSTMLWYTEIAIGSPPQNFTVHLDTGSDALWVNCEGCKGCPTRNDTLGIKLSPYNPNKSKSARTVARDDKICEIVSPVFRKYSPGGICPLNISYIENTTTLGYYVTDLVSFNQFSGNQQNQTVKANVTFACATERLGVQNTTSDFVMTLGVEGLIGFDRGNASMISQLASQGKVRNEFAHCLDDEDGGIFVIGHVVHPKVKMAPLFLDMSNPKNQHYSSHYTILLESVDVYGNSIKGKTPSLTLIDSGTTFVLLPKRVGNFLVAQISSKRPEVRFYKDATTHNFTCFHYSGRMAEDFPVINFKFTNSLTFQAYPHEYILPPDPREPDLYCFGWQEHEEPAIFGDLFLRNRLVVHDAENNLIGWKEYNCSSNIEVEDDTTGDVCSINAHNVTARGT